MFDPRQLASDIRRLDYADDTKLALIGWLLTRRERGAVLGTELPFLDGKQRADIVAASDRSLSAFEIKGPRDDLRKLAAQTRGYVQMFLTVWLVTSETHIADARAVVPKSVGLISTKRGGIDVVRQAIPRNTLRKEESIRWLRSADLIALLSRAGVASAARPADIEGMRALAKSRLTADKLSQAALRSIAQRLRPRYESFLRELGEGITLDDLRMLQIPSEVT